MTKGEKIFDRTMGLLLFLAISSAIIYGIITVTVPIASKPVIKTEQQNIDIECVRCGDKNKVILFKSNSVPDSINIECEECKYPNTRSLFQFIDTTNKQLINPKNHE